MSYPNPDNENNQAQEKEAQLNAQKEILLKQFLSPDARLRLNNVRMVKPDLARLVENYILNFCLLYTSPSPRDATLSSMPSSA